VTIRIGISGWLYPGWRGVFYPKGLPQRRELEYASTHFPTVEINGTFYSAQPPECFRRWHAATPEGFVFAVKGSRFITHMKKLKDVEIPLANFFASGVLALGEKLGPILWQLPPQMAFDEKRVEDFLRLLPRDTAAALALARRHDHRVRRGTWLEIDAKRPLRHAMEIRNESFRIPQFVRLLRRHNVALVFADAVAFPYCEDLTADFVYCRLHGSEELYSSGYDAAALDRWAERIATWAAGREPPDRDCVSAEPRPRARSRDVYLYFDNDAKVRAPFDAAELIRRLGGSRRLRRRDGVPIFAAP
jgi:uncharacterized protein YecE (DUF72 family)